MDDYAKALADGIVAAVPGWVERAVARAAAHAGLEVDAALAARAHAAGTAAAGEVGDQIRRLLDAPIDEQRTTPLSIVRGAVRFPTAVLRDLGARPATRDAFASERFPDDPYDLSPASLADLDPGLVDAGIAWGAAKAMAHKARHEA